MEVGRAAPVVTGRSDIELVSLSLCTSASAPCVEVFAIGSGCVGVWVWVEGGDGISWFVAGVGVTALLEDNAMVPGST